MSDDYLPFGLCNVYIYIYISVCVARSNSTRTIYIYIYHLQKRGSLATVAGSCPSWTLHPSDMSDFAPKGLRDFRSFLRIFPKVALHQSGAWRGWQYGCETCFLKETYISRKNAIIQEPKGWTNNFIEYIHKHIFQISGLWHSCNLQINGNQNDLYSWVGRWSPIHFNQICQNRTSFPNFSGQMNFNRKTKVEQTPTTWSHVTAPLLFLWTHTQAQCGWTNWQHRPPNAPQWPDADPRRNHENPCCIPWFLG